MTSACRRLREPRRASIAVDTVGNSAVLPCGSTRLRASRIVSRLVDHGEMLNGRSLNPSSVNSSSGPSRSRKPLTDSRATAKRAPFMLSLASSATTRLIGTWSPAKYWMASGWPSSITVNALCGSPPTGEPLASTTVTARATRSVRERNAGGWTGRCPGDASTWKVIAMIATNARRHETRSGPLRVVVFSWPITVGHRSRMRRPLEQERLEHIGPGFLIGRDDRHHIGDRHHAAIRAGRVDDQQMVDPVLFHQAQAVVQRAIGRHGHERRAHDLADVHPGGAFVLGGDLVRDVALRDDADQLAAGVEDADRAHLPFAQVARGVVHGDIVADRIDVGSGADEIEHVHHSLPGKC